MALPGSHVQVEAAGPQLVAVDRDTLPRSYRSLLDRYEMRDAAMKVVGVGTACWVILLLARESDPLFLQVKQARSSVLEPYAGASEFPNHGQRAVNGYRLMQPDSGRDSRVRCVHATLLARSELRE